MQKTEADRQIAELEKNASKLQETINDLQGKIDNISNGISFLGYRFIIKNRKVIINIGNIIKSIDK